MARGNMEIVREILDGWGRGDFRTGVDSLHPEITFETFMPDSDKNVVTRGLAEMEAFTRDWLVQWRDYRVVPDEFREAGPETVFVCVRQIAEGRQSRVAVESPGFAVWTVRDGRVVRLSLHYDRQQALAAAGLDR